MKKKSLIILAIILALPFALAGGLAVFSVGAYYVASCAASKQYKDASRPGHPSNLTVFEFGDEFRINLADGRPLRAKVALGYEKGSPVEGQINERKDVLRNIANLVLSGKRKADITSVQQQLDLREELRASFNHVVGGGIEEVYFNEFTLD